MVDAVTAATHTDNSHIEIWKIRKLIQKLDNVKGNGTSMVTLVVPPKDDINIIGKKLT